MEKIGNDFEDLWNQPHIIRTIDGNKAATERPNKSDLLHYNY